MHIVAVAWIFVVILMTLAEATAPNGTVLGACFTLLLYGLLPLGIVLYVMGTPARRRARRAAEAAAEERTADDGEGRSGADSPANASGPARDGCGQPPRDPVAPERKEP